MVRAWATLNQPDETWAEFSTLEFAIRMLQIDGVLVQLGFSTKSGTANSSSLNEVDILSQITTWFILYTKGLNYTKIKMGKFKV